MRPGVVIGAVLLIVGAFIGLRGLNYSTQRSVVKIGEFEARLEERRAVPVWVGGVIFLAGLGLLGYSLRRGGDS